MEWSEGVREGVGVWREGVWREGEGSYECVCDRVYDRMYERMSKSKYGDCV